MKFKDIKNLIYDDLILIIGTKEIKDVSIEKLENKYDNYEVIGIRSKLVDPYEPISYVMISLKEPLFKTEPVDLGSINEKTFGTLYQCRK